MKHKGLIQLDGVKHFQSNLLELLPTSQLLFSKFIIQKLADTEDSIKI